ncbi:MAG: RNA polymerase sigma factor SigJ [Pseudomonadota bacterium]
MSHATEPLAPEDLQRFETSKPKLLGLAYRILGSYADAEDAVQDTFLKWSGAPRVDISNTEAWLMKTCTHRCLDMRRTGDRARVDYVGAWLPEPIEISTEVTPEDMAELSSSLTMAFLLVLERLSPKERAAFLLHEIFDQGYDEIATTLDLTETACRKLVSRARQHVSRSGTRHRTPHTRQIEISSAFRKAVTDGEIGALQSLLAEDVRLTADGGGKVPTIRETLRGRADVSHFVARALHRFWADQNWEARIFNARLGFQLFDSDGPTAIVSFALNAEGRLCDIFIVRNPDKLRDPGVVRLH